MKHLSLVLVSLAIAAAQLLAQTGALKPNIVLIFCDDLGYADLGSYGHPSIRTPHLDRMAAAGQRWTSFYVAASVCTPSRAGLLTGRYPIRSGMCSNKNRVLFPNSTGGLPDGEITLAEQMKQAGYYTAMVGKWHLGHLPEYLPTRQGFDYYYGIPYSNDMDFVGGKPYWEFADSIPYQYYNVPLLENETVVERPVDQNTITRRYSQKVADLIKAPKDQPFFIYLAHSMTHIPLFASEDFRGKSRRGLYGDATEEIDGGIGLILQTLEEQGLSENTLVIFTSDNGPWLPFRTHGGSAGLLRDGKGTTWEGGMRVPAIFYWKGQIAPEIVMDMGSTLDIFPTLSALTGLSLPDDRVYDGYDLSATLLQKETSPRDHLIYYRGQKIYAMRWGPYKAHFSTQTAYQNENLYQEHNPPLLFNLEQDPGESYDIAARHPEVLEQILRLRRQHEATVAPVKDMLAERK